MRMALLAAGCLMVLMLVAASSGPVRIWQAPSSDVASPIDEAVQPDTIEPEPIAPTDRIELPKQVGTLLQVVAGLLSILAVVMALAVVKVGHVPEARWRRRRDGLDRALSPLPELPDLALDVDSARTALSGGTPRNAIVACWVQLESDAAAAGLPRLAAETAAEYAERVVGASSVDPAPIGELAALYREARFSRHELDDDHRKRAFAALERVEAALRRRAEVPT
jgi:Domain of unknown function (DUF4129)